MNTKKKKENEINQLNKEQLQLKKLIDESKDDYEKIIDHATNEIESFIKKASSESSLQ